MEEKSKISNTEWGLFIAALFCIDLIQIFIDIFFIWFMGINVYINFMIDMVVGMSIPLYLQLRGESMKNPKRIFSLLATFGLEMIPLVSDLPLWGLDGIFLMTVSKSDKMVKNAPMISKVVNFKQKLPVHADNEEVDRAA